MFRQLFINMKKSFFFGGLLLAVALIGVACSKGPINNSTSMQILSSEFKPGQPIPVKYTCDGENSIPPLEIVQVPEEAVSLVLIMDDPDVPKDLRPDGNFDHWLAWNISPRTKEIKEGVEPDGIIGNNSRGDSGYTGPCPPDREHRYFFKLFALDTMLEIPQSTMKADLEAAMKGHILQQAVLMGVYNRPQNQ